MSAGDTRRLIEVARHLIAQLPNQAPPNANILRELQTLQRNVIKALEMVRTQRTRPVALTPPPSVPRNPLPTELNLETDVDVASALGFVCSIATPGTTLASFLLEHQLAVTEQGRFAPDPSIKTTADFLKHSDHVQTALEMAYEAASDKPNFVKTYQKATSSVLSWILSIPGFRSALTTKTKVKGGSKLKAGSKLQAGSWFTDLKSTFSSWVSPLTSAPLAWIASLTAKWNDSEVAKILSAKSSSIFEMVSEKGSKVAQTVQKYLLRDITLTLPESVLADRRVAQHLANVRGTTCQIVKEDAFLDIQRSLGQQYHGTDDLLSLAGGEEFCNKVMQLFQDLGMKMFDQYDVLSVLGKGGYGFTLLVQSKVNPSERFAVKGMGENWTMYMNAQNEFKRQLEIAKLNLAPRVYEIEEKLDSPRFPLALIRMDLVDLTLQPILRYAGANNLTDFLRTAFEACATLLQRMVRARIFHGDFHPGNIALTQIPGTPNQFKVQVIDFGRTIMNFARPLEEVHYFLQIVNDYYPGCFEVADEIFRSKFPGYAAYSTSLRDHKAEGEVIAKKYRAGSTDTTGFNRMETIIRVAKSIQEKLRFLEAHGLPSILKTIRSSSLTLNHKPLNTLVRRVFQSMGTIDGLEYFDVNELKNDFIHRGKTPALYFVQRRYDLTGIYVQFIDDRFVIIVLKFPEREDTMPVYRTLNRVFPDRKSGGTAVYFDPERVVHNTTVYATDNKLGYWFDPYTELGNVELIPEFGGRKLLQMLLMLNCVTRIQNLGVETYIPYIQPFNIVQSFKTIVGLTKELNSMPILFDYDGTYNIRYDLRF